MQWPGSYWQFRRLSWNLLRDVFNKKSLHHFDEYIVAWSLAVFTTLFLVPPVILNGIPELNQTFWLALPIGGCLDTIAFLLLAKAIKSADLSLVAPITTFSPLFLLITSPLIVSEFPAPLSLVGILLVVIGSYVLNLDQRYQGYFAPFKALFRETGPRLTLMVAFIWSVTANVDKIGVLNSGALFWAASIYGFIAVALLPVVLYHSRASFRKRPRAVHNLAAIGLFNAMAVACQMLSFKLTLVVYAIAIKRNSAVFSVLFGHFFFKEKGVRSRSIGATIMVLGAIAIAIF